MRSICFYLYCPEEMLPQAKKLMGNLGVVGRLSYQDFLFYYREFNDLGEINLSYKGLQRLSENLILVITDKQNNPFGFCLFKIHRVDLVEIDIIVIRTDLRGRGLGKKLYGRLERGFDEGTALYVENTTFAGSLFFKRCGFFRDVDLIKVISDTNRLSVGEAEQANRWAVC